MKLVGIGFIVIGATLLLFVAYNFFKEGDSIHSPLPQENGVKVIFVTPTK